MEWHKSTDQGSPTATSLHGPWRRRPWRGLRRSSQLAGVRPTALPCRPLRSPHRALLGTDLAQIHTFVGQLSWVDDLASLDQPRDGTHVPWPVDPDHSVNCAGA